MCAQRSMKKHAQVWDESAPAVSTRVYTCVVCVCIGKAVSIKWESLHTCVGAYHRVDGVVHA